MKANTILKILALSILSIQSSIAQLTVGNKGIFISTASILTVDGFSLIPSENFPMSDRTLEHSDAPIAGIQKNSIKRVYTFNEPVSFNGVLGIHYALSELNGNLETQLRIAIKTVSSSMLTPSAQSTVVPSELYIYNSVNQSIQAVTAMEAGTVLPVTLVSFNARRENQAAILSWITSCESNSGHFEIQKSLNGADWQTLGIVGAAGESIQRNAYSFTDILCQEVTFFRLKMVDLDGSYTFSRIQTLAAPEGLEDIVYPNPVQDRLHINPAAVSRMRSAEIYDLNGKLISKLAVSVENDLGKLLGGVYVLRIKYLDGTAGSFKVLKL